MVEINGDANGINFYGIGFMSPIPARYRKNIHIEEINGLDTVNDQEITLMFMNKRGAVLRSYDTPGYMAITETDRFCRYIQAPIAVKTLGEIDAVLRDIAAKDEHDPES